MEQSEKSAHVPVLLHEVVEALTAGKPERYLDGTLGGAGHALSIARALTGKVTLIGLDRDPQAIARAEKSLAGKADRIILENESFRKLDKVLEKHGIATVDAILLDLGISSDELDLSGKGFSFQRDEPVLMTMGAPETYSFTAKDILNDWAEGDIANVIYAYGEERYARRIAHGIVIYRTKKPIETTHELAEIVKMSVPPPYRRGKIHPSTRTFQALRIAVNDELAALKEGVAKGFAKLAPKGRMAVISFHSLEDRIVKEFFKQKGASDGAKILTKKPIIASAQEIAENPRSRSAKLRVIEKAS